MGVSLSSRRRTALAGYDAGLCISELVAATVVAATVVAATS